MIQLYWALYSCIIWSVTAVVSYLHQQAACFSMGLYVIIAPPFPFPALFKPLGEYLKRSCSTLQALLQHATSFSPALIIIYTFYPLSPCLFYLPGSGIEAFLQYCTLSTCHFSRIARWQLFVTFIQML